MQGMQADSEPKLVSTDEIQPMGFTRIHYALPLHGPIPYSVLINNIIAIGYKLELVFFLEKKIPNPSQNTVGHKKD